MVQVYRKKVMKPTISKVPRNCAHVANLVPDKLDRVLARAKVHASRVGLAGSPVQSERNLSQR